MNVRTAVATPDPPCTCCGRPAHPTTVHTSHGTVTTVWCEHCDTRPATPRRRGVGAMRYA